MPQEVLVALRRGAEDVRAPDGEDARPVLGRVRVLAGEPEAALAELAHDVLGGLEAGAPRLVAELEGRAVEARERGQPAEAPGERVQVGERAPREEPSPERGGELLRPEALVAPLVGREVEERRRGLLARRADPVDRK